MPDDARDNAAETEASAAVTSDATIEASADTALETGATAPDEQTAALDSALGELLATDATEDESPVEETPADEPSVPGSEGEDLPASETPAESPEPAARMIDPADAVLVEAVSGGLTWIPFAVYLGLWIVLAGVSAYLLYGASSDQPARWMSEYVPLLWSGVALTALGPVLSVVVWFIARLRRPKSERRGLFASAMTRGALAAFFGVAIWVATLFVLELVASGGAL